MRIVWIIGVALVLLVGVSPVGAQTYGTNWTAAYWNGSSFIGAPLVSTSLGGGIDFDWQLDSPQPSINADDWLARFTSTQTFAAGQHEFVFIADDGVRLYIDNILIFNDFIERPLTISRLIRTVTAGTHSLRVEYFGGAGAASLEFYWQLAMNPTVANGDFSQPIGSKERNWGVFASPTAADMTYRVQNNVFEFYRAPQPAGGNSAVVLQNTQFGFNVGTTLETRLKMGNNSGVRKRATILIHDGDFGDFFVCTFWLPPNTPLQTYRVVGSTRETWGATHISIYASSADGIGWLQVDDVELFPTTQNFQQTLCYDPETPPPPVATPEVDPR
ncbi:MAG: PA14 domain-containing protein [Chloroflexota bacterium]|nr:PA14 domain-containing protein [Chloroflexota bacterium]